MPKLGHDPADLHLDGSNASDLDRLHLWLNAAIGDLPDATRHAMEVALEEAVMNVVLHGCPEDITVRLRASPGVAALIIEDAGPEFDPTAATPRERPTNLIDAEPGGLGLTLLRHYCQDIAYERTGERNRLTLRFAPG